MRQYLRDLYVRKDLMIALVSSGLKAQNRNSFLGYLWWLLDPALNMLIYYFVVVIIFRRGGGGREFGLYLVIGILVWRWLSTTIGASSQAIIRQQGVISQIYLPKAIFPLSSAFTQLVNFCFSLLILTLFFLSLKIVPGTAMVWLPIIVLVQLLFMVALALPLSFFCVFLRDIDNSIGHFLRLWFFGSPVIWQEDMLPEKIRWLIQFNPVAWLLESYRGVLLHDVMPNWKALLFLAVISACVIGTMLVHYCHSEHKLLKAL